MPRIVIDIDENMYQKIKGMETLILKNRAYKSLELAVLEGTVLPEHYGRLIDADTFLAWLIFKGYIDNAKCGEVAEAIRKTTIIPATKEKSCKDCKYQSFREAYSCVETPCNACYEASHFETKEGDAE